MTKEDKELLLKDLSARLYYNIKGKITADCVIPHRYDNEGFPLESTFDVDVELNGINIDTEEISINVFENKGDLSDYIDECQSDNPCTIEEFKPYLRPMSSMTSTECMELSNLLPRYFTVFPEKLFCTEHINGGIINLDVLDTIIDFYNSHHLDWRGLIPKGLALEAPDGMYNIK